MKLRYCLSTTMLITLLSSTALASVDSDTLTENATQAFVNGHYQKAAQLYTPLARAGNIEAESALGLVDLKLNKETQGLYWLRKAADSHQVSAMSNLANVYETGLGGVKKDPQKAFMLYKQAAQKGDLSSANNVGTLYLKKGDYQQAKHWYEKAREYPLAKSNLGLMYYGGLGVPQNYGTALDYLTQAANEGMVQSMAVVGSWYATGGHGVTRDNQKAYIYLKLATASGNTDAAYDFNVLTKQMTPDALTQAKSAYQTFIQQHGAALSNNMSMAPRVINMQILNNSKKPNTTV